MPNHIHGIICILPENRRGALRAPESPALRAPFKRDVKFLSSIIAGFKASVTSQAKRELKISHVWQRNYYEHIIRSEAEWAKIRDYILTNPMRWQDDHLHPNS